jgi:hypothetical protein
MVLSAGEIVRKSSKRHAESGTLLEGAIRIKDESRLQPVSPPSSVILSEGER